MNGAPEPLLALAVAALGGLAVGIEREWSARRDADASRFGGVRTFLLLGLLGGLASLLAERAAWLGGLVLGGGLALVVVAYLVSGWRGTIDATTEVAGLLVLAAGALAGAGELGVGSAVFAATALVLVEKSRMHAAVARIQSAELEAAARFAVLALVVLPLLPAEPLPWLAGLEPRRLWSLVLLFTGLSFSGYLALRFAGPGRGYGWAGLLGGIVSSTAVTLNFARESRARPAGAVTLAFGALSASTVMPLRVGVLSAALNLEVARALLPVLLPALVCGAAVTAWNLGWRRRDGEVDEALMPSNPLRLGAAIQMTLLFAAVLAVLSWAQGRFGEGGLFGGAVFLGLTDLDALTYAMSGLAKGGTPATTAARTLGIAMVANSLFKATAAAALGAPGFRKLAGGGLLGFALLFAAGAAVVD